MKDYIVDSFTNGGKSLSFIPVFFIKIGQRFGFIDRTELSHKVEIESEPCDFIGSLAIVWRRFHETKPGHWWLICSSKTGILNTVIREVDIFVSGPNPDYPNGWSCMIDSMCIPVNKTQNMEARFNKLSFSDGILTVGGDDTDSSWRTMTAFMDLVFKPGVFSEKSSKVICIDLNSVKFQ